jgi:hypothetical protein
MEIDAMKNTKQNGVKKKANPVSLTTMLGALARYEERHNIVKDISIKIFTDSSGHIRDGDNKIIVNFHDTKKMAKVLRA